MTICFRERFAEAGTKERETEMKLKWKCDQAGQIRRGIEPQNEMEVEIDLSSLTTEQREKLASGHCGVLVEGTAEEVRADLQKAVEGDIEKERRKAEDLAAKRKVISEMHVEEGNGCSHTFDGGVVVKWKNWYVAYTAYVSSYDPLYEEFSARLHSLATTARTMTERAREEAMLAATEEIAAGKARAEAEKEAKSAAEKAEREAKAKRRAEIGGVEIEIERGDRDWGTPWGAVVRCEGGREVYDFSVSDYDLSTETLTIRCQPGSVIAWGQKNFRKPRRTVHERRRVSEDWSLSAM